jgi:hypothetical protein
MSTCTFTLDEHSLPPLGPQSLRPSKMNCTDETHLQPPRQASKRASEEPIDRRETKSPRLLSQDDQCSVLKEGEGMLALPPTEVGEDSLGNSKIALLKEKLKNRRREKTTDRWKKSEVRQRVHYVEGKEWCCSCEGYVERTNHKKCRTCGHYPCMFCLQRRTEDEKAKTQMA